MAILVQDSFNRADSTTTLGVADTGQTWNSSATWGIKTNQAYTPVAVSDKPTWIDSGVSDGAISVKIPTIGSYTNFLVFRYVDDNNFLCLQVNAVAASYIIRKKVAGTYTNLATLSTVTGTNGDVLSITLSGNSITAKVNGLYETTVTDTFNQTATKHGISTNNNATRFDDFLVESLTSGTIIDAGTIAISGETSLTSSASRILTSIATFQADTTFTSSAQRILSGVSSISADTNLSAEANRILSSNVNLVGDSSLTSDANILTIGITIDLSASSSLSADGVKTIQGASVLTTNSEVLATGTIILNGEIALSSESDLSVFLGEYYQQIIEYVLEIKMRQNGELTITRRNDSELTITQRKDFDMNI